MLEKWTVFFNVLEMSLSTGKMFCHPVLHARVCVIFTCRHALSDDELSCGVYESPPPPQQPVRPDGRGWSSSTIVTTFRRDDVGFDPAPRADAAASSSARSIIPAIHYHYNTTTTTTTYKPLLLLQLQRLQPKLLHFLVSMVDHTCDT